MQVKQHIKNLAVIRRKVGKTNTPRDHEKIGKEVTEAIKKLKKEIGLMGSIDNTRIELDMY